MRDCNHRCVLLNRPSITITSAVYDRRGLDCNSEIPLINSLNHLTYLTSNSAKVRETVANDGALIRLVSILHDCCISASELPRMQVTGALTLVEKIERERKLAMIAWKWTLAFQCLVLTGTRGTEQIRKQVVSSGVIPILATVLDNYLLLEKNYDYLRNTPLEFDFKKLLHEKDMACEELVKSRFQGGLLDKCREFSEPSIMHLKTDFCTLWNEKLVPDAGDENQVKDDFDNIVVSVPRTFAQGKIVPKADDVIWSLQLLAFISKYTHMKPHLQRVHLVESLSLRSALSAASKHQERGLDITPLKISATDVQEADLDEPVEPKENELDHTDPYLLDIESFCKELGEPRLSFLSKRVNKLSERRMKSVSERIRQMESFRDEYHRRWNYHAVPKTLDDHTWEHITNIRYLNLFPLVERFTVKKENERDMTYWSSVVMRNSCRKNETTGVRQCANFACGKWEDYPKRFAKCRRCKRTKYCSRECQLQSWNFHRYWCQEVGSSSAGAGSATNDSERNTPNGGNSVTGSLVEPSATDNPNAENSRSMFPASGEDTDLARGIGTDNTLAEGQ